MRDSTLRLSSLPLDLARDGELAEPKAGACSGLTLSGASLLRLERRGLAPPNGSIFLEMKKILKDELRIIN